MALITDFETPQGVTARYHRLLSVKQDFAAMRVTYVLAVYASDVARDSGKEPLWHRYVEVPLAALPADPRPQAYGFLASLPEAGLEQALSDVPIVTADPG